MDKITQVVLECREGGECLFGLAPFCKRLLDGLTANPLLRAMFIFRHAHRRQVDMQGRLVGIGSQPDFIQKRVPIVELPSNQGSHGIHPQLKDHRELAVFPKQNPDRLSATFRFSISISTTSPSLNVTRRSMREANSMLWVA